MVYVQCEQLCHSNQQQQQYFQMLELNVFVIWGPNVSILCIWEMENNLLHTATMKWKYLETFVCIFAVDAYFLLAVLPSCADSCFRAMTFVLFYFTVLLNS